MQRVIAESAGGHRILITTDEHTVVVDHPVEDGGAGAGATPTELFAGAIAACAVNSGARYLQAHGFSTAGLRVACDFELSMDSPRRIAEVHLTVTPPAGLDKTRLLALERSVEACILHRTLLSRPLLRITMIPARAVA